MEPGKKRREKGRQRAAKLRHWLCCWPLPAYGCLGFAYRVQLRTAACRAAAWFWETKLLLVTIYSGSCLPGSAGPASGELLPVHARRWAVPGMLAYLIRLVLSNRACALRVLANQRQRMSRPPKISRCSPMLLLHTPFVRLFLLTNRGFGWFKTLGCYQCFFCAGTAHDTAYMCGDCNCGSQF